MSFKIAILSLIVISFSITTFAKPNASLRFEMIGAYTYSQMPKKQQMEYVDQIQKVWMEFEKKYPSTTQETVQLWQRILFETAHADDKVCIIGGCTLAAVNVGKGKYVCPTKNKPCPEHADGFRCGPIFGEGCISRTPISNISERCYKDGAKKALSKKEYQEITHFVAQDFSALCASNPAANTKDGCTFLAQKMNEITKEHHLKIAGLDEYNKSSIAESSDFTTFPKEKAVSAIFGGSGYGVKIPGCSNGKDPDTKFSLWLPQFDLLSGKTCAYENNQNLLGTLAHKGCDVKNKMNNLFTTRIQSKNKTLLDGQADTLGGIVDSIVLDEKKSDKEAIYSVRMIKHDISKSPIAPQQVTYKVKQSGSKFYLLDSYGPPREVSIENTYRPNFLVENFTALDPRRVFATKAELADNCKLAADLKELQANGVAIAAPSQKNMPGFSKGVGGSK